MGVRKAEGGIRATAYKNCYTNNDKGLSTYRPLFWYTNGDEADYDRIFNVKHSQCYSLYGFKRTGCAGCPFARELFDNLKTLSEYEPNFVKAANYVFSDSYEYTRKYKQFCKEQKEGNKLDDKEH